MVLVVPAVGPRIFRHHEARRRLEEVRDHQHVARRQVLQHRVAAARAEFIFASVEKCRTLGRERRHEPNVRRADGRLLGVGVLVARDELVVGALEAGKADIACVGDGVGVGVGDGDGDGDGECGKRKAGECCVATSAPQSTRSARRRSPRKGMESRGAPRLVLLLVALAAALAQLPDTCDATGCLQQLRDDACHAGGCVPLAPPTSSDIDWAAVEHAGLSAPRYFGPSSRGASFLQLATLEGATPIKKCCAPEVAARRAARRDLMSVDSGALADWPVEPDVASPPPPNSMDACRALESTGMVTTRNKETDLFSDAQVGYLDMLPVKWGDTGTAILRGFRLLRGGGSQNPSCWKPAARARPRPNTSASLRRRNCATPPRLPTPPAARPSCLRPCTTRRGAAAAARTRRRPDQATTTGPCTTRAQTTSSSSRSPSATRASPTASRPRT